MKKAKLNLLKETVSYLEKDSMSKAYGGWDSANVSDCDCDGGGTRRCTGGVECGTDDEETRNCSMSGCGVTVVCHIYSENHPCDVDETEDCDEWDNEETLGNC